MVRGVVKVEGILVFGIKLEALEGDVGLGISCMFGLALINFVVVV